MYKNSSLLILAGIFFAYNFIGGWAYGLTRATLFRPMLVNYAWSAGEIVLIFLLILNGSFINSSIYRKVTWGFAAVLGIGLMLKILHWVGGNEMLVLSMAGFPLVYTGHFIQKNNKGLIDYLKYLWALSFFIGNLSVMLHWPGGRMLLKVAFVLLLILVGDLIIKMVRNGKKDPEK